MKKEMYSCDTGSVALVIGDSTILISNGYGDGCFKVYELDQNEFSDYKKEHQEKYGIKDSDYEYFTLINVKNAKVMEYDCWNESTPVLFTLDGRYHVYYNYGKVYFVKIVPWR